MPLSVLFLVFGTTPCQIPADASGMLHGVVVNISQGKVAAGHSEVLLQVLLNGELVSVKETIADDQGEFSFSGLPIDGDHWYVSGANRDGVHYPGPRVRLTSKRVEAWVELQVCDAVQTPNPLVIDRQEITIRPAGDAIHVTELITVENATKVCYIGCEQPSDGQPVTMRLAIPGNFERVTFQQEFFYRQFTLVDGRLVSGNPWPPGRRDIEFTYVIPVQSSRCIWERPLDLPCRHVSISVQGTSAEGVACDLPQVPDAGPENATFESEQTILPAGHLLRVELTGLPVSAMALGRWIALGVLVALVLAAMIVGKGRLLGPGHAPVESRSPDDVEVH